MPKQEHPQHQKPHHVQVQPEQKAAPMIKNYLTIDELTEILDELEVEYEVELDDSEENKDPFITCVMSEEPFNIVPLGQGPFYEEFLLRTVLPADFDPYEMCNQFNRTYNYCSAFTSTIHTDSTEDEEQTIVAIERAVMLCGGVTRDHIISTFQMWETILLHASSFFNGTLDESA
jgi:hypothetical protein